MRYPVRNRHRIACFVLLSASALSCAAPHAESVFKCRGADGLVAFQDHPCTKTQAESQVEIEPPPPAAPSPDYGRGSREARSMRARGSAQVMRQRSARTGVEVVSYECRAANGELFYRHGACPKQITAKPKTSGGVARKRGASDAQAYAVAAQPLSRSEVCRQMARAGSIGRAGHERDESVSTYDKNLGRDPCRRY
jgi:hypothetical protein